MKNNKDELIVIVGCGRLGSNIANNLSRKGKSVIIIDKDEKSFRKLDSDFSGFQIEADAIEHKTLKDARLAEADILIATTDDDNTNIMIVQIAKYIYGIEKAISRMYDPERETVYRELGIETVCPMLLSSEVFIEKIEGREQEEK